MCSLFKEMEIVSLYLNRPVWETHCIALDTDVCDFILFKSFSFSLFSSTKGYSSITILKLFSELCVFATTVQCVFVLECCMNSFGNLEANYIKSSQPFYAFYANIYIIVPVHSSRQTKQMPPCQNFVPPLCFLIYFFLYAVTVKGGKLLQKIQLLISFLEKKQSHNTFAFDFIRLVSCVGEMILK